jgi:hypothetical protein
LTLHLYLFNLSDRLMWQFITWKTGGHAMQKIPLKHAVAGMVLARDVFRSGVSSGLPVCGKTTVLTTPLITRLENMDIASVYVEGRPLMEDDGCSLDDMLQNLEQRFARVRENPLMSRLYEIYADCYRRSMGDDGGRKAE